MTAATRKSLPVYLMEAALLGAFMVSACGFATLLEHPASVAHFGSATGRRAVMAVAMAGTAALLLTSVFARRTGAHMNPAVTLATWRLGKISGRDAAMYAIFQFLGGAAGVGAVWAVVGRYTAHPAVNYAATRPGGSVLAAFLAECVLSFVLLTVVLTINRVPRLVRFTPYAAATLVGLYVFIEAPISGMSMNPARTLASAIFAEDFTALWVYFTAPPLGMLAAAEVQRAFASGTHRLCPKAVHCRRIPCHCACDCLAAAQASSDHRTSLTERASHVHAV